MIMDYRYDYPATGRFLRSNDLSSAVRHATEDVAEAARLIVVGEAYDTGELLVSIDVEPAPARDRVGWAVTAEDPAAAPTEFGNARMPRAEVVEFLERGARDVGLDLREGA